MSIKYRNALKFKIKCSFIHFKRFIKTIMQLLPLKMLFWIIYILQRRSKFIFVKMLSGTVFYYYFLTFHVTQSCQLYNGVIFNYLLISFAFNPPVPNAPSRIRPFFLFVIHGKQIRHRYVEDHLLAF